FFFFQAEDGIRDRNVTGVQTCALPILMKYTDIKKKLTPHSFRHSHISMMTESGIDLPTIMQRVGHEDPDTTLKVYTHVTEKMKVKSIENLSKMNNDLLENLSL